MVSGPNDINSNNIYTNKNIRNKIIKPRTRSAVPNQNTS